MLGGGDPACTTVPPVPGCPGLAAQHACAHARHMLWQARRLPCRRCTVLVGRPPNTALLNPAPQSLTCSRGRTAHAGQAGMRSRWHLAITPLDPGTCCAGGAARHAWPWRGCAPADVRHGDGACAGGGGHGRAADDPWGGLPRVGHPPLRLPGARRPAAGACAAHLVPQGPTLVQHGTCAMLADQIGCPPGRQANACWSHAALVRAQPCPPFERSALPAAVHRLRCAAWLLLSVGKLGTR